jgi:exodeoxyribonuclease VII small subunit
VVLRKRKSLDDQGFKDLILKINIIFNHLAAERPDRGVRMPKERFEDALNKLEKIVSKLEEGDIPLEESLKLFEEGIRLSRFCSQKLDEAEKKVEILLKDKNGVIKPRAFDPSTSSGRTPLDETEEEEEEE